MRVVVAIVAVVLAGASAYWRLVRLPELTVDRFGVWVVGAESDLRIDIDPKGSYVHVSGAAGRVPELLIANGELYVPSDSVSNVVPAVDWVRVPLEDVDSRFALLSPARLVAAIHRGTKQCEAPSADAIEVLELLLPSATPEADGFAICERSAGLAADAGSDVFVATSRERPDEAVALAVERSASYRSTSDPEDVLARIDPGR